MNLNPFKKKKKNADVDPRQAMAKAKQTLGGDIPEITDDMIDQMLNGTFPGAPKMNMMQKMALKGIKKMSPAKRKEAFAQAFAKMDEKGGESKEEMLTQIEEMREKGQLNSKQYKIAKKRLGIK